MVFIFGCIELIGLGTGIRVWVTKLWTGLCTPSKLKILTDTHSSRFGRILWTTLKIFNSFANPICSG